MSFQTSSTLATITDSFRPNNAPCAKPKLSIVTASSVESSFAPLQDNFETFVLSLV